jgi:hypothetical protein
MPMKDRREIASERRIPERAEAAHGPDDKGKGANRFEISTEDHGFFIRKPPQNL